MPQPSSFSAQAPPFALPVLDISPLFSTQMEDRQKVAAEIGKAARNNGFFYITGHGISTDLRNELIHQAKQFFDLPLHEKMNLYIGNSRNHRGYVPPGEEVFAAGTKDRKEAFDLASDLPENSPQVQAATPMMGPNVWPDLPDFPEKINQYYQAAIRLGNTLFRGFALALGLPENYFEAFVTTPPSQLRLIHYPWNPDAVDEVGIGAHTDYECFTILLSTSPGLEVMDAHGQWIDAPPVPDGFVVNIGDMMEIWTNGEFVATSHRVRKVQEERYSFPLFCLCDYHTVVQPLPQFVSEDRPSRFQPVIAGDHLFAQTAQTFTYLKKKLDDGSLTLPDGSHKLSSFGQESRYGGKEMSKK